MLFKITKKTLIGRFWANMPPIKPAPNKCPMTATITDPLILNCEPDVVLALAQLTERLGWTAIRQHAASDDEAHLNTEGIAALARELAAMGCLALMTDHDACDPDR